MKAVDESKRADIPEGRAAMGAPIFDGVRVYL